MSLNLKGSERLSILSFAFSFLWFHNLHKQYITAHSTDEKRGPEKLNNVFKVHSQLAAQQAPRLVGFPLDYTPLSSHLPLAPGTML